MPPLFYVLQQHQLVRQNIDDKAGGSVDFPTDRPLSLLPSRLRQQKIDKCITFINFNITFVFKSIRTWNTRKAEGAERAPVRDIHGVTAG